MNNTGNYNECQDVQCTNYGPIAYWIGLDWLLEVTRDGIYLFRYVFRYLFGYVFRYLFRFGDSNYCETVYS